MIGAFGRGPTVGLGLDGSESESETAPFCGVRTGNHDARDAQTEGPQDFPDRYGLDLRCRFT